MAIYYDLCYLCFSSRDFLTVADDNDEMYLLKTENVSAPAAAFDAAVAALLSATADPTRRFATGQEAPGGGVPAIYVLAQCTPDITPAPCRRCLANITRMAPFSQCSAAAAGCGAGPPPSRLGGSRVRRGGARVRSTRGRPP